MKGAESRRASGDTPLAQGDRTVFFITVLVVITRPTFEQDGLAEGVHVPLRLKHLTVPGQARNQSSLRPGGEGCWALPPGEHELT